MLWLLSDCPDTQEGENDSGTTGKKKKKKKKKPAGAKTEEAQGKPVSGLFIGLTSRLSLSNSCGHYEFE